jgi:hypothetical protein
MEAFDRDQLKFVVDLGDSLDTPYEEAPPEQVNACDYIYVKVGNVDLKIAHRGHYLEVEAFPREGHPDFEDTGGLEDIGHMMVTVTR